MYNNIVIMMLYVNCISIKNTKEHRSWQEEIVIDQIWDSLSTEKINDDNGL